MAYKLINGTEVRNGTVIMIEGEPCTVRSYDVSKTGKHGHAKVRIEAIGVTDGKKRVIAVPGHERFEVPNIDKRKGQVLSIGDKASIMDLETFETMEIDCPDDVKEELEVNGNAEYWDVEGAKIVKRKL